jgi:hypothetical protein
LKTDGFGRRRSEAMKKKSSLRSKRKAASETSNYEALKLSHKELLGIVKAVDSVFYSREIKRAEKLANKR